VYLYTFDGKKWNRQIVDQGGVSAAACVAADLDGDGTPDLACIGGATHNLKWYRVVASPPLRARRKASHPQADR
jgi:hypothetical protein